MNSSFSASKDTIDQIIAWIRHAGQIALRYFDKVTPRYKPDQTFFTQADLEIERFLAEKIHSAFPDYGLIGEEGAKNGDSRSSPGLWTIDPLDGTTAFVQKLPGWGISLGLLDQGQPRFGVFYMPLLDDMTHTNGKNSAYNNGRRLHQTIQSNWEKKGFLAVNASAHRDFQINVQRIRALGSISASLVYTARGAATAAFIPRAYIWDLVAGAAILEKVGGEVRYLSGKKINYLQLLDGQLAPEPIVAGHPDLLNELKGLVRSYSDRQAL